MKLDIKAFLILALIVGAVALFWLAPSSGLQAVPALKMTTIDGETVDLNAMRGKPYMVVFWATDCSGCIKEMPHLLDFHQEFKEDGFRILGVAVKHDKLSLIQTMREQRNISYDIIHDADGVIAREFGNVNITPTNILISADGRIVLQKMGEFEPDNMRERIRRLL